MALNVWPVWVMLLAALTAGGASWEFQAPPSALQRHTVDADWRAFAQLSVAVTLRSSTSTAPVICSVFLTTKDNQWYESKPAVRLTPGQPHVFALSLAERSPDWEGHGVLRPWGRDVLRWVRTWGIKVFSASEVSGVLEYEPIWVSYTEQPMPTVAQYSLPATAVVGSPVTAVIGLDNVTVNPFRTRDANLWLELGDGATRRRVRFVYCQAYAPLAQPSAPATLVPRARPCWRAEWVPDQSGSVPARLTGTIDGIRLIQELGQLEVVPAMPEDASPLAPSSEPAFAVTTDAETWYQPAPDGWTPREDVGASVWQVPLDWTTGWGDYTGLGEFNQKVAWQFEQDAASAAPRPILLFTQDELEERATYRWAQHPLNAANGGPLADPQSFFTDSRAHELILDRARYLWGRYRHRQGVNGLAVVLDRAGNLPRAWLDQLARDLAAELPDAPFYTTNPYLQPRTWRRAIATSGAWQTDPRLAATTTIENHPDTGQTTIGGDLPLAVVMPLPGESWATAEVLMVDIASRHPAADQLRVQCFLRTWRDVVFEAELQPLPGAGRYKLAFPLATWRQADNAAVSLQPYDLLQPLELGIRVFAGEPMVTAVTLGPMLELWGPVDDGAATPGVTDVSTMPGQPTARQPLTLSFTARPLTDQPFDRREANLSVRFERPDGITDWRPAWLHLPLRPTDDGHATRDGDPVWRATYTPPAAGTYRVIVSGTLSGETIMQEQQLIVGQGIPVEAREATALRRHPGRFFVYQGSSWTEPDAGQVPAWWSVPLLTAAPDLQYGGPRAYGLSAAAQFDAENDLGAQAVTLSEQDQAAPLLIFSDRELRLASAFTWPHEQEGFYRDNRHLAVVVERARYLWARYGGFAGIEGVAIDLSRPGEQEVAWIEQLAAALAQVLPGVPVISNNPALPARAWEEPVPVSWQTDARLSASTRLARGPGGTTLVRGKYPGTSAVTTPLNAHWVGAATLALPVELPAAAGHHMKALVFVRTGRTTIWEHELLPLRGGATNRLYVRLGDPTAWRLPGQPEARPHGYAFLNIQELGVRFFQDDDRDVTITLGKPTLLGPYKLDENREAQLAIQNVVAMTPNPTRLQRYELGFQLNHRFRNPYDPAQVRVDIEWIDPAGETHLHPGFFHQPIELREVGGSEHLSWGGAPDWRVRFTPQLAGEYRWRLIVRSHRGTATHDGCFTCVDRQAPGFVRLSPQDPRCLEFSDGQYFYPIGHNLRSPSDRRKQLSDAVWENVLTAERQGIYAFRRWFRSMADHGENFSRMWLCSWWAGLEWNADTPGYHGLGYYNQENAARVDRVLEFAEQSGIYLNLEPMNHGRLSTRIDEQWTLNPLCEAQPGGFLRYASDFFGNQRAQELHRQRMRYVIARWGYSPAIAFWGIITETEWVEAYDRGLEVGKEPEGPYVPAPYGSKRYQREVGSWLEEVGAFFAETDAHPHLVTTHFSNPSNGLEVWRQDHLQLMHNNAYTLFSQIGWEHRAFAASNGVADVIHVFAREYEQVADKPILIGEWGGTPYGDPVTPLRQELHTGLWAMAMTNSVGVTGWWWWNLLDAYDDYSHFQAIARFTAGEDRRGRDLQTNRVSLLGTDGQPLVPPDYTLPPEWRVRRGDIQYDPADDAHHRFALLLYDQQGLWAYTYLRDINRYRTSKRAEGFDDPAFPLAEGTRLPLPDTLPEGRYLATFWNTWTGQVFSQAQLTVSDQNRQLPLPPHRSDLALKLTPLNSRK